MTTNHTDTRFLAPRDLASDDYSEIVRSKEDALRFLSLRNCKAGLAAALVIESRWLESEDQDVIQYCHEVIEKDDSSSNRIVAINLIGRILDSTRSNDDSRILARIILDDHNLSEVKKSAYWALRRIQFGIADVNFSAFHRGVISEVKSILNAFPGKFAIAEVKDNLCPVSGSVNSDACWDSSDTMDLNFVNRMARESWFTRISRILRK